MYVLSAQCELVLRHDVVEAGPTCDVNYEYVSAAGRFPADERALVQVDMWDLREESHLLQEENLHTSSPSFRRDECVVDTADRLDDDKRTATD